MVDKYPLNVHYLGFVARFMQGARMVLLDRHPLDVCVALFRQPHFNYSFDLQDLARYYLAYRALVTHWQVVIPDLHVVSYETMVSAPEATIDALLNYVGVEPDERCYRFFEHGGASATASSVQVREKMHTRSVGQWRHWDAQLAPLIEQLEQHGVTL